MSEWLLEMRRILKPDGVLIATFGFARLLGDLLGGGVLRADAFQRTLGVTLPRHRVAERALLLLEHLFTLRQAREAYTFCRQQMGQCDAEIEWRLRELASEVDPEETPPPPAERCAPPGACLPVSPVLRCQKNSATHLALA